MTHPHRREFTRSAVRIEADFVEAGRVAASGPTRDVGLRGIYVVAAPGPAPGTAGIAVLRLGGGDGGPRLEIPARVVRRDADGFALEFAEVDLDALEHLKALVLYNAAEPERVAEEFDGHLGLERAD